MNANLFTSQTSRQRSDKLRIQEKTLHIVLTVTSMNDGVHLCLTTVHAWPLQHRHAKGAAGGAPSEGVRVGAQAEGVEPEVARQVREVTLQVLRPLVSYPSIPGKPWAPHSICVLLSGMSIVVSSRCFQVESSRSLFCHLWSQPRWPIMGLALDTVWPPCADAPPTGSTLRPAYNRTS